LLLIGEKILLICSKYKKNKLRWVGKRWLIRELLSASILHDLEILGNLVVSGKRTMFLKFELHGGKPTENLFLQEILDILQDTRKLFLLFQLMKFLGKKKRNLEDKLWNELENKGIIGNQKREHILIKPETRNEIISNLHTYLIQKSEPDPQYRALFALLYYSGRWKILFGKSEWNKKWVKQIISDDKISKVFNSVKRSHESSGVPIII